MASINQDLNQYKLFITELEQKVSLEVQFVPLTVSYDPQSNFVAIASPGRNNKLYHYTGSEDILRMRLDWHAIEEAKDDVIRKCRWLEGLTKNSSYDKPPPPVTLIWGGIAESASTDNTQVTSNRVFAPNNTWLVTSAPWEMSLFDRQKGMLPRQAYQSVTFKRITKNNRSRDDVYGRELYYRIR